MIPQSRSQVQRRSDSAEPAGTIAVCVITWNSEEWIEACLEAILAQSIPAGDVVVVDNASRDGTRAIVERFAPRVRLIRNPSNRGFAAAANQGVRETSCEFFATVNPDVRLGPRFLETVVATFLAYPEAGMVSGCLLREEPTEDGELPAIDSTGIVLGADRRGRDRRDPASREVAGEVFATCGAAGAWRRAALGEIAYPSGEVFDESFFCYKEDLDAGWRAQRLGWKARYVPDAIAIHERQWRGGPHRRRMTLSVRTHSLKNRYLMIVKNETFTGFARNLLPMLWFEVRALLYLALFEPGLWQAYPAAVRHLPGAWEKRRWLTTRRLEKATEAAGAGAADPANQHQADPPVADQKAVETGGL